MFDWTSYLVARLTLVHEIASVGLVLVNVVAIAITINKFIGGYFYIGKSLEKTLIGWLIPLYVAFVLIFLFTPSEEECKTLFNNDHNGENQGL